MSSTIRIYYEPITMPQAWNEVCARAVEMFGLPGDKFTACINLAYMDFTFKSNKDALMFALEHNGEFVTEQQRTLDYIPTKIF